MLKDFIVGYKLSKRKKRKYRSLNNLLPSIRLDGNLWPFCHSRRRLWLFLLQDCFRRGLSSLPSYLFLFLQLCNNWGQGEILSGTCIAKRALPNPLTQNWFRKSPRVNTLIHIWGPICLN